MCSKSLIAVFLSFATVLAEPTKFTIENNKKILSELPFVNKEDFEDSSRGFIALANNGIIKNDQLSRNTLNSSLWQQSQILFNLGFFQVAEFVNKEEVEDFIAMLPDSENPILWQQSQILFKLGLAEPVKFIIENQVINAKDFIALLPNNGTNDQRTAINQNLEQIESSSELTEPTKITIENNKKVLSELPFANKEDFEDSAKGFIAPLPNNGIIKNDRGEIVWNQSKYQFLIGDKGTPDTVNPSLWRQAQILFKSGLFQVADRIYQVRGADISNMTIIEGNEGIIVIDPLLSIETAKAALNLYYEHRPNKPITNVIYTHSHADHFGGVKGIISQEDVDLGKVKIYAPSGFTEAALDENVMAGNAMARRALYMYGTLIEPGPNGQTSAGLGLTTSNGTASLILPTDLIGKTGEERTIDGVKFQFIYAPNSEAPAEMMFFIPELKALAAAEDATHNMHNIYSLRGAKIRDAKAWANYLNQAIEMFGDKTDVVFAQHHWPKWGTEKVVDFLEKQRDMYKYLHDQTLHLANQGYTMLEIGEMLKLPPSLSQEWYNRDYYGSTNHNAKAVYNFYLGWFDGNPSTLHQLPPVEASKKYVEYMGGSQAIMDKAKKDFDEGSYRWVAQALNHVVYAEPSNKEAKDFLAKTLEQLGYQAENGPWRNFYLTGAKELRNGVPKNLPVPELDSPDVISAMPLNLLLDYASIRLNGPKAAENPLMFNLNLPDRNEQYTIQIKNGVLNYFANKSNPNAEATVIINRADLDKLIFKQIKAEDLIQDQRLKIEGDPKILSKFLSLLDPFNFWFNIVEPRS